MGRLDRESIGIAGIGCSFPGNADSLERFWNLLMSGGDTVSVVPPSRWDAEAFYHPDSSVYGRIHCKYGSFLSDETLENFDPLFFGITPLGAVKMDVQQRWLLEAAYRALEDAGLGLKDVSGSNCGVYIGVSAKEYGELVMSKDVREIIDGNSIIGNSAAICSNRLSYTFNLKGPSITMDTACSSSLVALHTACQAIWNGEIDSAIVGGVNAILAPEVSLAFSTGGFLSPDGRCKAFDHRANGYVRAEGCGVVYLKPLSKTDKPYAAIVGTSLTQDGFTVGISMPDQDAQARAILNACADAGLSPDRLQYVEAHGTGTKVGDKIEATSIGSTIGLKRKGRGRLLVGSVKTNIGHCEPASGMAGLIKLALSMKHGRIPGNLHMEKPNPDIPFDELNIEVPTAAVEWPAEDGFRFGGINSFGFGGTNGHAVLSSVPDNAGAASGQEPRGPARGGLFALSAKSKAALERSCADYAAWLRASPGLRVDDVCATQARHRSAFPFRLAVHAQDTASLAAALEAQAAGQEVAGLSIGRTERLEGDPGVVFVFSGQGAQWWGMGRELMDSSPAYLATVRRCGDIMRPLVGWDLEEELRRDEADSIIKTSAGQLALLGLQMGLCSYWESVGLKPAAVVGHSIGEVPAAWAAGIITMEEAVQIIYYRMLILDKISDCGTMLAVGLSEKKADEYLRERRSDAEIGTVNGVNLVVLTGRRDELERIEKDLAAKSVYAKFLQVTGPFHSRYIDQYRDEIMDRFAGLKPRESRIPFYSTVWGCRAERPVFDAEYAFRNLRQRVLFVPAISRMMDDGWSAFVEIGPHPILAAYVSEIASTKRRACLALPTLRRKEADGATSMSSLAALYVKGYPVDPGAAWADGSYERLKPPPYPFQRERCWLEPSESRKLRIGSRVHPLIKSRADSAGFPDNVSWRLGLSKKVIPWIAEHVVQGNVIFPAAGICESALACGLDGFGDRFVALEDVRFKQGLYLPKGDEETPEIILSVCGEEGSFKLSSRPAAGGDWSIHCSGRMRHRGDRRLSEPMDIDALAARFGESDRDDFGPVYEKMLLNGLDLGPSFRAIRRIWIRKGDSCVGEAYGEIEPDPRSQVDLEQYNIHPAVLDSCWQILIPVIVRCQTGDDDMLCLPVSVGSFSFLRKPTGTLRCYGRLTSASDRLFHTDVWIFDSEGRLCFEILDFTVRHIEGTGRDLEAGTLALSYRPRWTPAPIDAAAPLALPRGKEAGGQWLVFADAGGRAAAAAERLAALGERVVVARAGQAYGLDGNRASVRPSEPGDFARLFRELCSGGARVRGAVFAWALDAADAAWDARARSEPGAGDDGSSLALSGLYFFKAFSTEFAEADARAWVLTANAADARGPAPSPAQSGLVGVARVALHENPSIATTLVDLDTSSAADAEGLARELLYWKNDEEVAYRGTERLGRSLVHVDKEEERAAARRPARGGSAFRLKSSPGLGLDGLGFKACARSAPTAGRLEVRVSHAPVNAQEAASVGQGDRPGDGICSSYAGIVERVGEGVSGFAVGDAVCGLGRGTASSYLVCDAGLARPLEPGEEPAEAAIRAWEACVARMALECHPRSGAGDSVLLVVGPGSSWRALAAMARGRGCAVTLAAPDAAYRRLLGDCGYELADEGEARGFDAVICLCAEASLFLASRSLRHGGKIVVTDPECVRDGRQISASFLARGSSLAVIDLKDMLANDAASVAAAWRPSQEESLGGGWSRIRTFGAAGLRDAFAAAQSGLESAALDLRDIDGLELDPLDRFSDLISPDASYAITGGCKGIGLAIALELARQGARFLVLAGRTGAGSEESAAGIAQIEAAGATVRALAADIADPDTARAMLSQPGFPPVRGIIHCAAVFDDALMQDMDESRFMSVYGPKAIGAMNLHRASLSSELDFFVCFSSVSAAYGNPSQANYAAANAFTDALCLSRREAGLAGLSLSWGVIGGAGYLTRARRVADMLESQGWRPLGIDEVLFALEKNILEDSGYRLVMDLDWTRMALINPADLGSPRFSGLMGKAAADAGDSLSGRLASSGPDQAKALLEEALKEQVARIIGMKAQDIDAGESITALGLDSLMVNQLRNWIVSNTKVQVTMMKLMMGPSVRSLAEAVLGELSGPAGEAETADSVGPALSAPIPAAPEADTYIVSSSQRRVLMLSNIDADSTNYNIQTAVRIRSAMDPERALAAFRDLVGLHEALRTSFVFADGDFRQRIETEVELDATYKEFPESEADAEIAEFCGPFDLSKAPLFRVLVGKMGEADYLLVIEAHHAIADGTSAGLLMDSFFRLYSGRPQLPAPVRYVDYCVWQEGMRGAGAFDAQKAFWLEQLSGEIPALPLPLDFPRPARQAFDGGEARFRVGPAVLGGLKTIATRAGSTLPMVMLAAFKCFLFRYTGEEDIIVGMPTAARRHPDLERLIGQIVNAIPIRSRPMARKRFSDYLVELRKASIQAYENQDYPFDDIFDHLDLRRDLARNPLFDVSFVYQGSSLNFSDLLGGDGSTQAYPLPRRSIGFDLSLECFESADGLDVALQYSTRLFRSSTAARMAAQLERVIDAIVEEPQSKIGDLPFDAAEGMEASKDPSPLEASPAGQTGWAAAFAASARGHSSATALSDGSRTLDYAGLLASASGLAMALRTAGVAAGVAAGGLVCVPDDGSMEAAVALLGAAMSGATALALAPDGAEGRLAPLASRGPVALLGPAGWRARAEALGLPFVDWLERAPDEYALPPAAGVPFRIMGAGTGGEPSCVGLSDESVMRFCSWHGGLFGPRPGDVYAAFGPLSCARALGSLLSALLAGAAVVRVPRRLERDAAALSPWLAERSVSFIHLPAPMAEDFIRGGDSWPELRSIASSGAALRAWAPRPYGIYNIYAPAECGLATACFRVEEAFSSIPIGRPVCGARVRVLDADGRACPVGAFGELCVSSTGLVRAAGGDPAAAAEDDPLDPGRALFRTGDRGRWREGRGGELVLELMGRGSDHARLRGYRVDMGEVESEMARLDGARSAVALPSRAGIAAFWTGRVSAVDMKRHLRSALPESARPTVLLRLESMPLTAHGTVDRKALIAMAEGGGERSGAPSSAGFAGLQPDGLPAREARLDLGTSLSARAREAASRRGVGVHGFMHLAWAMVLARYADTDEPEFASATPDRAGLGLARVALGGERAEACLRLAHVMLAGMETGTGEAETRSSLLDCAGAEAWAARGFPVAVKVDQGPASFGILARVLVPLDPMSLCAFMRQAIATLANALDDPESGALADLDVMPASEKALVLETWNATSAPYPENRCLHELFQEQAARTPDAPAVSFEGLSLSYAELDGAANGLARRLRASGVGPDRLVAICAERGFEMIIGLMGILKAGGAYVPLDPSYPVERLNGILADCRPAVLLAMGSTSGLAARLESGGAPVLDIADSAKGEGPESSAPASAGLGSRNLAYVIYTSGSTGKPKGAMNEHRSVVNRLAWGQREYRIGPGDAILQKTPFSFDVSVFELFWPLLNGARLVMARPGGHKSPDYLADAILAEGITMAHFVPSMLRAFLAYGDTSKCRGLKKVFCSGEALPAALAKRFRELLPDTRIYNLYGPTEAAVEVTAWECTDADSGAECPIGRPIANARMYALDSRGRPAPAGAAGELYIAGVPVGRGYLGRPDLSAERFVPDPFSQDPAARMYRTGDLGRWTRDGAIEFLGRNDFQVKLRGFRIELGEIEASLLGHGAVAEAAVVARDANTENMRLVAYYAPSDRAAPADGKAEAEALRAFLAERLPEYMVPAAFVRLDAMPVGENGKLDRSALPEPDRSAYVLGSGAYAPGSNAYAPGSDAYAPGSNAYAGATALSGTELRVAALWREIICAAPVSPEDSFFALGGNSISAMRLAQRLRDEFGVELPITAVFTANTLGEMAAALDAAKPAGAQAIAPAAHAPDYPVSKIQESFLIMDQAHGAATVYNQTGSVILPEDVPADRLRAAVELLTERHEALRTSFARTERGYRQKIAPRVAVRIEELGAIRPEDAEKAVAGSVRGFDLFAGPLFRVSTGRVEGKGTLLVFDFHHSVMDGFSIGVFASELNAILGGSPLPAPPRLQYKDFCAHWERVGALARDRAYWLDTLRGVGETFLLPVDRPRPAVVDFSGGCVEFALGSDLVSRAERVAAQAKASLFAFFMSVFSILQARYSGKSRTVVGMVDSGRQAEESLGVLGPFVNVQPILGEIEPGKDFLAVARSVAERVAGAIDHASYSYEDLSSDLRIPRLPGTNFLFQTVFAWQNIKEGHAVAESLAGAGVESVEHDRGNAMYELHLIGRRTGDGCARFWLSFRDSVYERSTVERMARDFASVAEQAARDPGVRVADIALGGRAGPKAAAALGGVLPDGDAFSFGEGECT